ncbi:MAG TPA: hypothetical protein VGR25_03455 [bacterium]|nr:hypothetical protein [bacterium]
MAPQDTPRERLANLKRQVAADSAALRGRWRAARGRVPQDWDQIRSIGRDVLQMIWLLLRRRGDSTPPRGGPSSE